MARTGIVFSTLIPLLFVALWSTGFIGAKYGLPEAEPFTFLLIRMSITVLILLLIIPFFKVKWPRQPTAYFNLAIVGILIHGIYLGGVFSAISRGVDSGLSAVIVGLQPLVTVILSVIWLKESLSLVKIAGLLLGLTGIILVIHSRGIGLDGIDLIGLLMCFASLLAISVGTIYQKRYCTSYDLLPGICVQYIGCSIFLLALSLLLENHNVVWSTRFIVALSWLVLVLSIGAVLLLMWLIRHGEAGKVASLFYLVPPFVAVEAWFLFGEKLSAQALVGIGFCVAGVALAINAADKKLAPS